MIDIGKIFILRKPKQIEVNLSPETKKVIVEHNDISEKEIELKEESLQIEKQKLKTQDRVDISLSEYSSMKSELEYLRKIKKAYTDLTIPIMRLNELPVSAKQNICNGKINFVKVSAFEDFDPCNFNKTCKIALYFTTEVEE